MGAVLRAHRQDWFGGLGGLGILCVNDPVALAARGALGPRAAVYGIDGLPEAVAAGLPTVRQPLETMAAAAADALYRQQAEGDAWQAGELRFRGEPVGGAGCRDR